MTPTESIFSKKRRLILVVGCIVLFLGLLIWVGLRQAANNSGRDTGSPTTNVKKDPTSGESFYTQEGVAPESAVVDPNIPVYAGFSKLLDVGVSADQVTALQHALQHYKPFAHSSTIISLAIDDIQQHYPEQTDPLYRWSISSHIVINQKTTYRIKFYYWGISNIQLFIYDATGNQQLFDSGVVTN